MKSFFGGHFLAVHLKNVRFNRFSDLRSSFGMVSISVKEQCIVLFPYNSVNDDELTLEEGQVVTIISKDVEDKGWWKGEIDGKVGVFPVNYCSLFTEGESPYFIPLDCRITL